MADSQLRCRVAHHCRKQKILVYLLWLSSFGSGAASLGADRFSCKQQVHPGVRRAVLSTSVVANVTFVSKSNRIHQEDESRWTLCQEPPPMMPWASGNCAALSCRNDVVPSKFRR